MDVLSQYHMGMKTGDELLTEGTINGWCLVVTVLAITIVLFLLLHPSNCASSFNTSLASVVACLFSS